MRNIILAVFGLMILASFLPSTSRAANWPDLPPACTPDRAGTPGLTSCVCPPSSLCPQNFEEFSNPATYRLPLSFVMNQNCCGRFEPTYCPAGSYYAGQAVPSDGVCNPELCPAGTAHPGEPRNRFPGQDCGTVCPLGTAEQGQPVPAGGCTPAPNCPVKYYPSFAEAATGPEADGYTYQNGQRFNFVNQGDADLFGISKRLEGRYGWSIRVEGLNEWVFGPQYCLYWDPSGNNCYVNNGYVPLSGGANTGHQSLSALYGSIGASNLVWFGYSVVNQSILAPNVANPAILAAMANNDRIQLASHSVFFNGSSEDWSDLSTGSGHEAFPLDSAIENGLPDFLRQCRMVGGEFIELERKTIAGNQCAYVQCRYVYGGPGSESCLTENTKVTLADGTTKAVKDIALGDVLKSPEGKHKVIAKNAYQSGLRVLYGINGGDAMLTGDHPIMTKEGWKVINDEAAAFYADKTGFAKTKLAIGDVIMTEKGEVKVSEIKRFPKVDAISTYNVKIEGNGGFFANGIEVKAFSKMEMHYE